MPVEYFVRYGPAQVDGNTLKILPLPPRAHYPVEIAVAAYQWGQIGKVQSAPIVEQVLRLEKSGAEH